MEAELQRAQGSGAARMADEAGALGGCRGSRDLGVGHAQQHDVGVWAPAAAQGPLDLDAGGGERPGQRVPDASWSDDRQATTGEVGKAGHTFGPLPKVE